MEHVLVELAPGRQREHDTSAAAVMQSTRDPAVRQSRSSRRSAGARRPARHGQQAARQRAELREFQSALARWAR